MLVAEAALRDTKEDWHETMKFSWQAYRDPDLKRKFKKYSQLDEEALPEEKYKKLLKLTSDMQEIYSTAKICDFYNETKCDLSLEPGKFKNKL